MVETDTTPPVEPAGEPAAPGRDYHSAGLTIILAALVTAQMSGLVALARTFAPEQRWGHLIALIFLVSLEAIFTTRWLRRPAQRLLERGRYRVAEYIVLALLIRFILWGLLGMPSLSELRLIIVQPGVVLDGTYIGHIVLLLFPWLQAINLTHIYDAIVIRQRELARFAPGDPRLADAVDDGGRAEVSRQDHFAELMRYWLNGGMILVVITAITTIDIPKTVDDGLFRGLTRLDMQPVVLWGLLVYFVLGLWLISHARLQVLRARWMLGRMDFSRQMGRTWYRNSLLILFGIAFLAAFLPIGSTLPIAYLINLATSALLVVVTIFFQLLFLLFTALLSPFFGQNDVTETPLPTAEPLGTAVPATPPPPLIEPNPAVTGSIFWTILIVVVSAALLFYLRERGVISGATLRGVWQDWLAWLRAVWSGTTERVREAGDSLRQLLRRDDGDASPPWRFVRLNALSPRERIRYFYLSTVRRAQEKGVPRRPAETPLEFVQDLKENWPEAEEDLEALTEAFLHARYSRQEFGEADLNPIKQTWQRVRSGIRRRRKRERETKTETESDG